jgi:hypothetical protein
MNSRLHILALTLLLLAQPALGEPAQTFAWDLSVAPATDDAGNGEQPCRDNPYALYHRGCPDQLNPRPERFAEHLNILDQLLLLADRYKDVNLEDDIRPNAKLKFTMGLLNLYEQEAKARLELRIRF